MKTFLVIFITWFIFIEKEDSLWGVYEYENDGNAKITLTLKQDSTFEFDYKTHPSGYETCGTYEVLGEKLILSDYQDSQQLLYEIDCETNNKSIRDTSSFNSNDTVLNSLPIRRNIWTVFDNEGKMELLIENKSTLIWIEKNLELKKQTGANN